MGLHFTNALPVVLGGHVHIAICLTTSQMAFTPQVLLQGFTQRCLTQAICNGHSELIVHSGRQAKYGSPLYSGKQEQIPLLHTAFDPQGDGLQGFTSIGSVIIKQRKIWLLTILKLYLDIT